MSSIFKIDDDEDSELFPKYLRYVEKAFDRVANFEITIRLGMRS